MAYRLTLLLSSVLASGLLATACGAKSKEAVPGTTDTPTVSATAPAKATSTADSGAADSGAAFDCMQYVGQGFDNMSQPAAYLFVGAHPMCTDKEKVKDFCDWLPTRRGFLQTEEMNRNGEAAVEIAKTLPEEARGPFLSQHPKQVFEQALQKCDLNLEQLRSKLVAEAESAIAAGSKADPDGDVNFILKEAPARGENLWKRECNGHYVKKTVAEDYEWVFQGGNAAYTTFCMKSLNSDTSKLGFKVPSTIRDWTGG